MIIKTINAGLAAVLLACMALIAGPARADDDARARNLEPMRLQGTIAAVATAANMFSTLLSVLPPDLTTALSDPKAGPFTVFAPTDVAFRKFSAAAPAVFADIAVPGSSVLRSVLTYHVVPGLKTIRPDDEPQVIKTLQGQVVFARVLEQGDTQTLKINNSVVTGRPIRVDNGIIYVIDSVLLPQFR